MILILDNDKKIKLDSKSILSRITDSLDIKMKKTYEWIHTDEGQIIVRAITSLSSYVVGDPTGVLMPSIFDSADDLIRKRFLNDVPDLINRLDKIKSQINFAFVKSDDGQKLLRDTIKNIIHETNEEKINYLKQFLISSYTESNPDYAIIKNYYKILENMEPIHIKLLTILKNPEGILRDIAGKRRNARYLDEKRRHGMKNCLIVWNSDDDGDDLNIFYLKTDPLVYQNALKDFLNWNITSMVFLKHWVYFQNDTFEENFANLIRDITRFITPFGRKFIDFVYSSHSANLDLYSELE